MNNQPLLSVVIANYNYGRFLDEAIQSLLSQSCQDFEIIICDAASTDNSVDIIRKYEDRIAWWCSEKDGGQSAAFNKGFSHAHGRFLTWLNADDVMLPGTIEKLKNAAEKWPEQKWWVGGVMWLNKDLTVRLCARGRNFSDLRAKRGVISVWGPCSFFTKDLLDTVGGVDERYFYCMDNNLWLKFFFNAGVRYRPFANYVWGLRIHEDAKMSAHNFAASGQQDPDHPKWKRLRQEGLWNQEIHGFHREMNKIEQLITLSPIPSLLSRFDTWRNEGKHYLNTEYGGQS